MKIQDVEQKTNLSKKAIRYYEEKELINIKRNGNGYRDYTEDNIKELLCIKLYRKCGLSIEQIKEVQDHSEKLDELLYDRISEYDKKDLEIKEEKELCLDVIRAKGKYDILFEYIEFRESEEVNSFLNKILDTPKRTLAIQLFQTLILLGPILNFFLYYNDHHPERLFWCFILSIIATMILTLSWRNFLKEYKFHKETMKEGLLHTLRILSLMVIFVVIIVGGFVGITQLQYSLYMKDSFYILAQSKFSIFFVLIAIASTMVFALSQYSLHFDFDEYSEYISIANWLKKHILIYFSVCLFAVYFILTSVTAISNDKIEYHSLIRPFGIIYSYQDIESIECGFYKNSLFYLHDKGDFYYKLNMKDGKTISLEEIQTTSQFEDDTYSEIEYFDSQVMKYNIKKISSDQYSQYNTLDKVFVKRFLSIINNK